MVERRRRPRWEEYELLLRELFFDGVSCSTTAAVLNRLSPPWPFTRDAVAGKRRRMSLRSAALARGFLDMAALT